MKQLLFTGLLLVATLRVAGQTTNVDSLLNVLKTDQLADDERIELLWKISNIYLHSNYDSCIMLCNEGLLLAKKRNNIRRMATFSNSLGMSYLFKQSFDTHV
jgi:hypothetical protein